MEAVATVLAIFALVVGLFGGGAVFGSATERNSVPWQLVGMLMALLGCFALGWIWHLATGL